MVRSYVKEINDSETVQTTPLHASERVGTLLLSRWEATLQSIISESSCTDQFTLCLVIIFRALWSASSCAGIRFFGSIKTQQSVSRQISAGVIFSPWLTFSLLARSLDHLLFGPLPLLSLPSNHLLVSGCRSDIQLLQRHNSR